MLSSIPLLQNDEKDVSYNVESLFTNIPIEETINYVIETINYVIETINYVIDQNYVHEKLTPICLKLIFDKTCYGMYF